MKDNIVMPIFDFDSTSTILYEGKSKIIRNNIEYIGSAKIVLDSLPKTRILIKSEFDELSLSDIIWDNDISFSINNFHIDTYVVSGQLQSNLEKVKLDLVPKKDIIKLVLNIEEDVEKVTFHIFNFFDIIDKSEIGLFEDGVSVRLDYFFLQSKKYNIKIQSLRNTSRNIKNIKEDGISKLTQVGRVEKNNGLLSIVEYEELQYALTHFFSFAKGSWVNPMCSVGKTKDNNIGWYLLNAPKSEWKLLSSWINPLQNTSSMSELFPLFMDLWELESWKNTLHEVIYWFLNANDGSRGVDAGLILAQTALERLSFEYVVNEKKLLSVMGFKDLRASDKFRILFSSLNIPLEIPSELIYLVNGSKTYTWKDAPHALTEIRNSLVHPEHKKRGKFNIDIFIQSYTLSLWYLEVSILAILRFKGKYSNRVKNGNVEAVPYLEDININKES